jgi:rhodanese-related sulfurtransferase
MGKDKSQSAWMKIMIMAILIAFLAVSDTVPADDLVSRVEAMVSAAKDIVPSISVENLAAFMENEDAPVILDIRTQAEFDQGHIKDARWVARGKLEFEAAKGKLPSIDTEIVVYCKKDSRAALAAKTLKELGFTHISYLAGGILAWVESGLSIAIDTTG